MTEHILVAADVAETAADSRAIVLRLLACSSKQAGWMYQRMDQNLFAVFPAHVAHKPEMWGWTTDKSLATTTAESVFGGARTWQYLDVETLNKSQSMPPTDTPVKSTTIKSITIRAIRIVAPTSRFGPFAGPGAYTKDSNLK